MDYALQRVRQELLPLGTVSLWGPPVVVIERFLLDCGDVSGFGWLGPLHPRSKPSGGSSMSKKLFVLEG